MQLAGQIRCKQVVKCNANDWSSEVQFPTKQELVSSLSDFFDGKTASVKIHKADGTIEEERTYPRSADPRRSKG
ncbi:hypothetical protein C206_01297 [Pseudomonas putida TRO1]|uniref:DUF2188 domain-containing protein n=1 Tax=Pseudomonas putida TRO1 TaxID=1227924 RepID=A0AAD2ZZL1_PSEPU|nr:DUF2188 domain-containing protein [Pseudomonas putida]ENY79593.1 hypothetical protein C206_01297 [Pseudomonas putida TRO1]